MRYIAITIKTWFRVQLFLKATDRGRTRKVSRHTSSGCFFFCSWSRFPRDWPLSILVSMPMLACLGLLHVEALHTPMYRLRYVGVIIYNGWRLVWKCDAWKQPPQVASKTRKNPCFSISCFSLAFQCLCYKSTTTLGLSVTRLSPTCLTHLTLPSL